MGKICWRGMGNRVPYLGTISILTLFCSLCVLYAFYKENQGLEVPRETRLEKFNASPGGIQKMHGGKAELSTRTIFGMYFRCKSQMEKIKVVAQGGGSRPSCGSYLGWSLL